MTGGDRVVLMMQGPMSPFAAHLRDRLVERGARVVKVHLCPGDHLFWRRPGACAYRGAWTEFGPWVRTLIKAERVTDLVVFGDQRVLHKVAIDEALAAGARVHAMDLGYFRPDWLTVEPYGSGSSSRMPTREDPLRTLAAGRPQPGSDRLARGSFLLDTVYDILYNVSNVALAPLAYPHYRRHAIHHPFAEYVGWLGKFARARKAARHRESVLSRHSADPRPTFLMPLQLSTDFQIRAHSPFPALRDAVDWIVGSFSRHAPAGSRLLFKLHPLDNNLDRWDRAIPDIARRHGVSDRVDVIDGGDLEAMLAGAAGVVTVNSTVGLAALGAGIPVAVLGSAVFDAPGLTHQGPLSAFWSDPERPDPTLVAAFRAALAHATQVRGGVITPGQIAIGAAAAAERILEPEQRLAAGPTPRPPPVFRRAAEWKHETGAR